MQASYRGNGLAFASHGLGKENVLPGYIPTSSNENPLGVELAFVTTPLNKSHRSAIAAGTVEIHPPVEKPWGQRVSLVRSPEGILVELCTPIGQDSSGITEGS